MTRRLGVPSAGAAGAVLCELSQVDPVPLADAHVWDFRDGKVVRFQQYTDTWQFAQVTGITPKS